MSRWLIEGSARHILICDDMKNVEPPPATCLIVDPEWDRWGELDASNLPNCQAKLVFTSPCYFEGPIEVFGAPTHVFSWDCRAADEVAKSRPLRRLKMCLWYGSRDDYVNNATTYAKGNRLQELYRQESISDVVGRSGHSYAKPEAWIKCLIGNTSRSGIVYDPFAGSGTTMWAADTLYRPSVLVERCEPTVKAIIREAKSRGLVVSEM